MERPFWRRIWAIQETVNARKTRVLCGKLSYDWELLAAVTGIIRLNSLGYLFIGNSDAPGGLVRTIGPQALGAAYRLWLTLKKKSQSLSLARILLTCHPFESTDPRDRIFALRQISAEAHDLVLRSDYNLSVEEVFIQTTTHLIRANEESKVLLCAAGIGYHRPLARLPSWVAGLVW